MITRMVLMNTFLRVESMIDDLIKGSIDKKATEYAKII